MKKLFAIAAGLMLIGTTAFAQSFGAGYVQSTTKINSYAQVMNGFYAGFGYKAEFLDFFSLNPGLYYEFVTGDASDFFNTGKTTEHYVNIPLHLGFGYSFSSSFRMFLYGGPTANIGIASTTKEDSNFGIGSRTTNHYEDTNYSRFDVLLGAGAGIELIERIRLTVGYDFGMFDRYNNEDITFKRNRLTAGLAFIF